MEESKILGYRIDVPPLLPRPLAVALLRWARTSKAGRGLRLVRITRKAKL